MPNAIEPPLIAPTALGDAYALLADDRWRPIAGWTDVMVQLTGEIGEWLGVSFRGRGTSFLPQLAG